MAEDRQSDPGGMNGLPKVVLGVELNSTAAGCYSDDVRECGNVTSRLRRFRGVVTSIEGVFRFLITGQEGMSALVRVGLGNLQRFRRPITTQKKQIALLCHPFCTGQMALEGASRALRLSRWIDL